MTIQRTSLDAVHGHVGCEAVTFMVFLIFPGPIDSVLGDKVNVHVGVGGAASWLTVIV